MNNEAFVYQWKNLTNGKIYIGYHKGDVNDGYISSSRNEQFWIDFNNPDMNWKREIISFGTKEECLCTEQSLLKEIDINNDKYYNNARGSTIIFTDNVLLKMSNSQKRRWENMSEQDRLLFSKKISNAKKGISRPKELRDKLSKLFKGKPFKERFGRERAKEIGKKISNSKLGKHYHSEEHKLNLSLKLRGNKYGALQSEETRQKKRERFLNNNPGKNKTDETKRKISQSRKGQPAWNKGQPRKKIICPHCGKEGGNGIMQRWHFDNCKHK